MRSTAAERGRFAISVYVLAVFHRTSLGVAGLQAAERFGISSAALSTFTIVQVFVYAAMQLPVGALLDRFGSKRLLAVGLTLITAAQLAFAFVDSYPAAWCAACCSAWATRWCSSRCSAGGALVLAATDPDGDPADGSARVSWVRSRRPARWPLR